MLPLTDMLRAFPGVDPQARFGLLCGAAAQLLPRLTGGAELPLPALLGRLRIAHDLGQCEAYADRHGRPRGFLTWAYVDASTEIALLRRRDALADRTAWRSGDHVWIADFVAGDGALDFMLADMRDRLFRTRSILTYARRRGARMVAKQTRRKPSLAFYRPSAGVPAVARVTTRASHDAVMESAGSAGIRRLNQLHDLGAALWLLHGGRAGAGPTLGSAMAMLLAPLALDQIRFEASSAGSPDAVLVWGRFGDAALRTLAVRPLSSLHPSEWNEGDVPCLVGFGGRSRDTAAHLLDRFLATIPPESGLFVHPDMLPAAGGVPSVWPSDRWPELIRRLLAGVPR